MVDYFNLSIEKNTTEFFSNNKDAELRRLKLWRLVMFRVFDQIKTNRRFKNKNIINLQNQNRDIRLGKGICKLIYRYS